MQWLASQREMWGRMAATDVGRKRNDNINKSGGAYFVEEEKLDPVRKCYLCGEEGHIRRFCQKKGGGRYNKDIYSKDVNNKRQRRPPTVKKYWCAYHKDDKTKGCWSNSCQELKRMSDVQRRIQLLKDNGDCIHCCGDHKPADCYKKD